MAKTSITNLPDLQILPGKVEFTYLPRNCPALLVVPIDGGGVLLGGKRKRCFRGPDMKWARAVAGRLDQTWSGVVRGVQER